MKPERNPHQRLIDDAMHEAWATGPEAGFAREAAAAARRRRAVRRALLAGGLAMAFTATVTIFRPGPSPASSGTAMASAPKPAYELISEEQLLLALADRPVLILPDEPGGKRIFLLHR